MSALLNYLWKASGEDLMLIQHCPHRGIRERFAVVGMVAKLVMSLTFISCCYTFQMLFDNIWMAVPVSVFFAWMVTNIYEVLLTTLAKPVLDRALKGAITHLSGILRIGFIVFFAVFISKPLEAWFFQPQLSVRVAQLKEQAIQRSNRFLITATRPTERRLLKAIVRKERLHYSELEIRPLRMELSELYKQRSEMEDRIRFVIKRADYFVERVSILSTDGFFMLSWLFTLVVISIFLLPVYLKRNINGQNPYLHEKKQVYQNLILNQYQSFKAEYQQLFWKQYQLKVDYSEKYSNPPFNTRPLHNERDHQSQENFLEKLYR